MSAPHVRAFVGRRHSCLRLLALITLCALGCHRENRSITASASEAQRVIPVREGTNQPGAKLLTATALKNPYEGNAYAISQGQQLFEQYNCAGCHFHGGGGIGPALMDDEWIYGSSPANIYESISEGRPNGMPSWGGHIPDYQIWQLVTYVRSMSNLEPQNATPVRAEEMQAKKAEE
jgi:cytochrome c oxidase cbb3-type subunit 3